eukprot:8831302-Pyramimonas_sp.AAC.2
MFSTRFQNISITYMPMRMPMKTIVWGDKPQEDRTSASYQAPLNSAGVATARVSLAPKAQRFLRVCVCALLN